MNENWFDFALVERFNFKTLDRYFSGAGIYLMEFPNGMRYLGKSKHINKRIRQHFQDFLTAKDWHNEAYWTFTNKPKPQRPNTPLSNRRKAQQTFDEELEIYYEKRYKIVLDFFKNVSLYVWEVEEADITLAENACLQRIADRGKKHNYYNTSYPREERPSYTYDKALLLDELYLDY